MGGLRKVTLSEAMEVLQDKNLQEHLYFKEDKQYCRVIDYEWIINHDRKTSLLNQTFYMELGIDIKTEEEK